MYTVFIIGNIASGKSTASRYLESRGAFRIDLDQMAKDLYQPGSEIVQRLAEEFGWDVLNADGEVRTGVLAARAFATPEDTARLNNIVHPVLMQRLSDMLVTPFCTAGYAAPVLSVVEISVAADFVEAFNMADEVLAVTAPLELRRERAIARGMSADDFDARASRQPSEEELQALATTVIDNTAADDGLFLELDAWLADRGLSDMRRPR